MTRACPPALSSNLEISGCGTQARAASQSPMERVTSVDGPSIV
eukprot:CAMPEP_0181235014 /NCGR_PEP_ID=MMETSP1096-20121128/37324_1 /TAXON_ID=156174 ORGANISM="Chrysochromulina ericina, Strain CCMP281" /NCGR_SAMPLE_ID=MMETSP1096 /ASSEMBLY_ACC=CAM_ASM_000453 /LENGTH=42 /DNA_ID= /DNA_START= /DNA_END= /DNA_ORIENTATION=